MFNPPDVSGGKKISYILVIMLIGAFVLPQLCSALSITYGSEYVFNSATTYCPSAAVLDATHALIAYMPGAPYYGTAIIATISDTISYGSPNVFNDAMTGSPSATVLDATHALIAYRDGSPSSYGTAIIATIGDPISFGSEYVFNSGGNTYTYPLSATALDATHALIAYRDGAAGAGDYGKAIIATIGDTISFGSEYVFNSAITTYLSATALDATHALIAYKDGGNSYFGTAIIATIGETISFGSEYVFNSASTDYPSATALDATHALIAYQDIGNLNYGTAIIATISDTISFGSEDVFNRAATQYPSATALDASHALIAYMDDASSDYGTGIIATIPTPSVVTVTGTDIAPGGASPGDTGVGFLKLGVVADAGEATWTDAKVDLTGTAVDGDISSVEVWKDDGDGTWEAGQDTEIGSGSFSSSTVTIDITDQTVTTSSQDFFIVYDIAGGADPSHTAGAKLLNNTYIIVSGSDEVSNTNFPIESNLCTLPVELSTFTIEYMNCIPTLYWSTASENDNIGWNLYRNCTDDSFIDAQRINSELIPGYGTTSEPHDYIYQDVTIETTPGDVYWYWIQSVDLGGMMHLFGPKELSIPEDPDPGPPEIPIPIQYGLHQNRPNPFGGISESSTKISFTLPSTGYAEVKIYNLLGQLVRDLYTGVANSDEEVKLVWDGKDENGIEQPTSIYLYQLKVNDTVNEIKRIMLIR